MLMTPSRYVGAALLLGASCCAADQASSVVIDSKAEPAQTTAAQLLEGQIDQSSTPILTLDDPLPEGSLLIESGVELQQLSCAGAAVEIRGDYRIVQLRDQCERVRIVGDFNVVQVETTAWIEIAGHDNAVTWNRFPDDETGRRKPMLVIRGERNLVAPGD
jgi:hypothetical protein